MDGTPYRVELFQEMIAAKDSPHGRVQSRLIHDYVDALGLGVIVQLFTKNSRT